MQCFNHPDIPAVMQCKGGCTRGLCKECAEKYAEPYCDTCVQQVDSQNKGSLEESIKFNKKQIIKLGICVVWGILMSIFGITEALGVMSANPEASFPISSIFIAFAFGGIPYMLFYVRDNRSAELKELEKIRLGGNAFLVKMLINFCLAAIACPIIMIFGIYQIRKLLNYNKELNALLATYQN